MDRGYQNFRGNDTRGQNTGRGSGRGGRGFEDGRGGRGGVFN